ncbi:MAG: hypothetical protein ACHQ50_13090 [Fimbriimonadales bacterium]
MAPANSGGSDAMKIRTILLAALVGAVSGAHAQSLKIERKYVVNESDTYAQNMTMASSMGAIKISVETTQTVKKVYDDGDADVEAVAKNMTVNMGGNEMHPPAQPPTVTRMTKYGVPAAPEKGPRRMNFARFGSFFGDKELRLGVSVPFDQVDKENPKNHSSGTVKLLSLDAGKAKLELSVDVYTDGAEKPMHVDGTTLVDSANGKMLRFEGKAANLPTNAAQGVTISSATFLIEKK